ncbi:MAG: tRNA pseudouridine(55) synthase TruB [Bacteroidetes bacterium CG2_30_33_31]|nr:MAG: tRNA pseudouridine(55) synthase TruB [Bacteroidetes bacterium CG2_30_33_31]
MIFDFIKGEVILIDKEKDWTSFDVVKSVRNSVLKTLNQKKIKVGHAGTLDPLATGLLIVCTGRKTKEIDLYQGADKVYEGIITIGAVRPSYDLETEISETFDISNITRENIFDAAKTFEGQIEQIPPMFSAVKVNGFRAYQLARDNQEVELKKRQINIHYFNITKIEFPDIYFEVKCSKGTYIRSLARDFGLYLNNGAHLKELRRLSIGEFSVSDALTISRVKQLISGIS